MGNLNAETVKKALECCNTIGGCKVCPYSCNGKPIDNGECGEKVSLDALALINSQEQRIRELAEENERLRKSRSILAPIRGFTSDEIDQIAKEMLEGENEN